MLAPGNLFKRLRGLGIKVGEPPSLLYNGITSSLTAQPRNILVWFLNRAPALYMHHRYALGVCLRGNCRLQVDATVFDLKPDQGIMVFPFQSHHFHPAEHAKFLNLAITFALENPADRSLGPLRDRVFNITAEDGAILREMVEIARGRSPQSKSEAAHLLARFLCRKLVEKPLPVKKSTRMNVIESKYDQIVRFIREHIAEPVSIKNIAKATNISLPHMRRIFKAHTGGLNMGFFITSLRIKRAYELLVHSELNVAEVAEKCGFSDQFVFSRAFKRAAGLSPTHFRRQIRQSPSRRHPRLQAPLPGKEE